MNNSGYVVIEDVGGRLIRTSTGGYLSTGGTWVNNSDAALKENFDSVNPREILDKLATMPISTWSYKAEDPSIRHLGPTAQDFAKSFALGDSYASISTVDADGVALAAVKGLYEIVREKDARITALEARVQALEAGGGPSMFNASTILVCSVLAGFGLFGSVIRRRTGTGGAQ